MSARQNQRCIVEVVANTAAGCGIKLRVYWAGAFWPRKLCIGFTVIHTATCTASATGTGKTQVAGTKTQGKAGPIWQVAFQHLHLLQTYVRSACEAHVLLRNPKAWRQLRKKVDARERAARRAAHGSTYHPGYRASSAYCNLQSFCLPKLEVDLI